MRLHLSRNFFLVMFHTHRDFHLHLSPNRKIFSSDFAAYVVDENNNKERYPVDRDEFYHGYLHGKSFGLLGREKGRGTVFRKREEWGEGMREKGGRYHYCSHFVIMFRMREEWEGEGEELSCCYHSHFVALFPSLPHFLFFFLQYNTRLPFRFHVLY